MSHGLTDHETRFHGCGAPHDEFENLPEHYHRDEVEDLLTARAAADMTLRSEVERLIADLDDARAGGVIYTYGAVQMRLRDALVTPEPRISVLDKVKVQAGRDALNAAADALDHHPADDACEDGDHLTRMAGSGWLRARAARL